MGTHVDLDELVTRYDLVGGEIRSAALSAAYGAAARKSAGHWHLPGFDELPDAAPR